MARPPKILVAKPGLDGHDRGAKVVASALRDAGMAVIYTGLHQTPEMIASAAVEEDVDVVGLSILSGAHQPLCQQVQLELDGVGLLGRVLWLVGGNVPPQDHHALAELGVDRVFPTGADFDEIATYIRERIA